MTTRSGPMRPRDAARSFGIAVIVYGLLMTAWLGVGGAYGAAFRGVGDVMFGSFGRSATVSFDAAPQLEVGEQITTSADAGMDTVLKLQRWPTQHTGRLPISTKLLGYLPTAVLMALLAATPLPPRRRIAAFAWGLAFVHLFIALRVLLLLLSVFSGDSVLSIFSLGTVGDRVLHWITELLSTSLAGCFLGPVIIWIGLALKAGAFSAREQTQLT